MRNLARHWVTHCQIQPSVYLEPPMVSRCGCIERQALKRPSCQEEDGPAAFPCRLESGCKEQRRLRRAWSTEQQQWRPGSAVPSGPCRAAGIQHPPQRLRHLLSAADQSEARYPLGPAHTEPSLAIVHSVDSSLELSASGQNTESGGHGCLRNSAAGSLAVD